MNKHERYNKSEKGRERDRRYKHSEKGRVNVRRYIYAQSRKRLRDRIPSKLQKIEELERILEDAKKV